MLGNAQNINDMTNRDLLIQIINELDEVKRYSANTYDRVDSEVKEMLDKINSIERQIKETDRQVDNIERFERTLNDIRSQLKQIERKV